MNNRDNTDVLLFLLGIPVALIVGLMIWLISSKADESRPITIDVVPNQNSRTFDVETTNPSTTTYRVTAARFTIREMRPPPLPVGAIEIQTVYFKPEDYDSSTNSYYKTLHDAEIDSRGNLNFRFFILDARYHDYTFVGTLTLYYGDRNNPQTTSVDHTIFVQ